MRDRPVHCNERVKREDVDLNTRLWRLVLDRGGFPVAAVYFNGRQFSLSCDDMEELQELIWMWIDKKEDER